MEKFVFGDMVRFIPTGERLVFIKTDKTASMQNWLMLTANTELPVRKT